MIDPRKREEVEGILEISDSRPFLLKQNVNILALLTLYRIFDLMIITKKITLRIQDNH